MQEKSIVFIVEKPSAMKALAPHLSARWPGRRIYAVQTFRVGLYEFKYKHGLRTVDFPYVGDPEWKIRLPYEWSSVWEITGRNVVPTFCENERTFLHEDLLKNASSIVFAADPDPSGAFAFHVLLSKSLGENAANARWPAIKLTSYDAASIEQAIDASCTTHDEWFKSNRNAGLARRFFDYNYNINAMAFFSHALFPNLAQVVDPMTTRSGAQPYQVSKYGLQLLYALRDQPLQERPEGVLWEVFHKMKNWTGTGRYPPCPLGSVTSQGEIVQGLHSSGLMEHAELSPSGRAFLDRLHPDCCDPDLPARIRIWEQDWPGSRPSMERYLRTFFGKQKRYRPRKAQAV